MSLQIKKPLSAQAVGTHMYKDGGVNQMKPATKQPEWSTKSLAHYRETEKNDLQRPRCPTSHNAWIWNTWWSVEGHGLTSSAVRSAAHFMMDKRQRGSDLPLWFRAVGTRQTSSQRVGTQTSCHWNSCSIARRARVSDPALGILEWLSRGQRADREDAGSERVITRVRLYVWVRQSDEETWTNGERAAHVLLHPTTTAGWASRVTCLRCFGFIWAKSVLCHTDSRQSGSFLLHLQTVDDQNCHHSDY